MIAAVVVAAVVPAAAGGWPNSGPAWSKQQARAALLSPRRIVGVDRPGAPTSFVFEVASVEKLVPNGPSVGGPRWRRFEVWAYVHTLGPYPSYGSERDPPEAARFCLHARARGFLLTGLDTILPQFSTAVRGACQDNAGARQRSAKPG